MWSDIGAGEVNAITLRRPGQVRRSIHGRTDLPIKSSQHPEANCTPPRKHHKTKQQNKQFKTKQRNKFSGERGDTHFLVIVCLVPVENVSIDR